MSLHRAEAVVVERAVECTMIVLRMWCKHERPQCQAMDAVSSRQVSMLLLLGQRGCAPGLHLSQPC